MGDLSPDMNHTPANESKRSIFDSNKFWGQVPRHRKSQSMDLENSPIKMIKEDSIVDLKLDSKEDLKRDTIVDLKLDSKEDSKHDSIVDLNENTPKQELEQPDPSTLSLHETISGNSIITRGWDGNNMSIYKTRRKML